MQQKTKAKLEQLNSEAGFSLLELIAVVAVLGLLASSLGLALTNQFESWEFASSRVQLINEVKLVNTYLRGDIAESTSYRKIELGFKLKQDRNGDGNIDRIISYQDDAGELKRSISYQSYLPDIEKKERVIASTFAGLEVGEESIDHQLDLELEFVAGGVEKRLDKSFYLADRQSSNPDNSLEFGGAKDDVALNHSLSRADYEELTLLAKIRTTEESGVIYGFDENQYFSLGIANGSLEFRVNPYGMGNTSSFSSHNSINDGKANIIAVTVTEDERDNWSGVNIYLNGEVEDSFDLYTVDSTFGSGNTSYGFLGVDSRASSFDGARANDYFAGQVYWLQHWDKALTKQQLNIYSSAVLSGKEDGLKAYYPISQQDKILYDYLGQSHGLILGPTYSRD